MLKKIRDIDRKDHQVIFKEHEKNKLLQIKRRFSRIDLFLKKECAGGT